MNRYPNLSLTLLLACALLPPFALKTLYSHLELYPSVILPSGAGKIRLNDRKISFTMTGLWGKDEKNDIWKRIDVEPFLAPIPLHYLNPVTKNSFGLNSASKEITNLPKEFNNSVIKKNILSEKVTQSEIKQTKQWLRQKLIQSGYAPNELMITSEKVNFDTETAQIINSDRVHEEIFRLD